MDRGAPKYWKWIPLFKTSALDGALSSMGDLGIISVELLLRAVFGVDSSGVRSISRGSGCFGEKKRWVWAIFVVATYTL